MLFRRKKVLAAAVPVAATQSEPEKPSTPRKKILVIDDDPITVKTLSLTLNARGYQVVSAVDGPEAITVMRKEKPDMMLVDVCLPPDVASGGIVPWDGFQVTRWLQYMNKKIPTIIMSGTDKPEYKQRAAAIGADAFLAKPITNEILLGAVALSLLRDQAASTATASSAN